MEDATTTRHAWVGLGSNLGDRRQAIAGALDALHGLPGVHVVAVSSLYETEAVGPPQPDYLNAAALLETRLSPLALLGVFHGLEDAAGRERGERWGPRTLDLDLLLYEDVVVETHSLSLPHPRMAERRFVLAPLCELNPDLRHPVLDRTVSELLEALPE